MSPGTVASNGRVHQNPMIDHHVIMMTLEIVVWAIPMVGEIISRNQENPESKWQSWGLVNGLMV